MDSCGLLRRASFNEGVARFAECFGGDGSLRGWRAESRECGSSYKCGRLGNVGF